MFSEFWNFFSNSIKFFNQILVLKIFYFIFLKTSLFMNFITLSLDLFEPWFFCCFPYFVSEFLFFVLFRMNWMLVTVNKVKFSLRKTFIIFSNIPAKECSVYKTEFALLEHFNIHMLACVPSYFRHYYFLWSMWHVMVSQTKF